MNIRLYNARVLTMEMGRDIFNGEIWIKNDRIAYTGTDEEISEAGPELPHIKWDYELDCGGNLLMPGLKNAHTHSGMTFLRSYADGLPLREWLTQKVFPNEAKLSSGDIYELTRLAVMEYVSGGTTAIFDMYLTPDTIAEACRDTGMRCVLCGNVNDHTSSPENMAEEYERLNHFDPLISYRLGIHAEYTCSKELIHKVNSLVHRYRAPFYCHLSETKEEVEDCKSRNGITPGMFLEGVGLFEYGGGVFHGVHLSGEEMYTLAKREVSVVTNPCSNLKLASGIAPVSKMLEKGLNIAIGTDGAASNNALDMFREMYLVSVLGGVQDGNGRGVKASSVLEMATVNGARAIGLKDADSLAAGKYADIILIDLHQPNMQPENDLISNIVYSGGKKNVLMTMIGGKILYLNGNYNIGENPEKIFESCNNIAERILG
ncbi:MAG: amidohydrolase [Lachnospiraceae bacterium]|nr:amidohydrolase [Lachnospiraceae bacterium]